MAMVLDVRLTRAEMAMAEQAATLRWQLARASGVGNQRRDARSDADIDLIGVKAEMAVAKVLQLPYAAAAMGVDSGADMWSEDVGIDVKASFHPDGRLLFKSKEAFKADSAVLVVATAEADVMRVVGGIGRDRFQVDAEEVDLGRGPCWIVPTEKLASIEDIWLGLTQRRVR
jgi:hypothetical protein